MSLDGKLGPRIDPQLHICVREPREGTVPSLQEQRSVPGGGNMGGELDPHLIMSEYEAFTA